MKRECVSKAFLLLLITVIFAFVLGSYFDSTKRIAIFNVVYNGEIVEDEYVEVTITDEESQILGPRKAESEGNGMYSLTFDDHYQLRRFRIRVDPSVFGDEVHEPFTFTLGVWTDDSMKDVISVIIEIDSSKPQQYNGRAIVLLNDFYSYAIKKEFVLDSKQRVFDLGSYGP